jgi:hypothetical protein
MDVRRKNIWNAALVGPVRLGMAAIQHDPPTIPNLFERRANLQGGKILLSNVTESEERDHQSVAYPLGTRDLRAI